MERREEPGGEPASWEGNLTSPRLYIRGTEGRQSVSHIAVPLNMKLVSSSFDLWCIRFRNMHFFFCIYPVIVAIICQGNIKNVIIGIGSNLCSHVNTVIHSLTPSVR